MIIASWLGGNDGNGNGNCKCNDHGNGLGNGNSNGIGNGNGDRETVSPCRFQCTPSRPTQGCKQPQQPWKICEAQIN